MSDISLSDRVQRIKPSPTLAITAKAGELRAQGKDIIGLGAGEPDFDTPDHIKQAAIEAINAGKTKYTPVDGTPGLKKAIIDKFKRDNSLDYEPNQILVSSGGKQSFFNMALALLNDGDEAIIPAPYWVSYPDMVLVAGGVPKILETDVNSRFKITPEQLEAAITPNTKAIVPVHLYGQMADMDPIMALAKKHSLTVIEDAAQAHGALYNDRQVGSIGDAGAFSFFGNKIITTGEGGMITTDDAELAHKARILRNHGMSETRTYWHDHLGFNYRMTNLQAAIGVAQLERIDEILKTKIALAQRYKDLLKDVPDDKFRGLILEATVLDTTGDLEDQ